MIDLTLDQAVEAMEASWVERKGPLRFGHGPFPPVDIDTRRLEPGMCFIAIEGKRHDGHRFIPEALQKGAAIIVSSEPVAERSHWEDRIFLQVSDTTQALQRLARYIRKTWARSIIGVTGSIGKTTTRVFITELLGQRFRTLQSPANFNNEIGVPLSLLRLRQEHELAVLELGMNHPGEIRSLAGICSPDAAVITNVAAVHLEFFPSLDAIAAAKGEILEALPQDGILFFNADDLRVSGLAAGYSGRKVSFSLENRADVRILNTRSEALSKTVFELETAGRRHLTSVPFVGRHFLYDLAAAIAVALAFEVTSEQVCERASRLTPPLMRGKILQLDRRNGEPLTIWDDSYNSSPGAVEIVLETVADLQKFRRKILVLGEMLELGPESPQLHRRVGRAAAKARPDLLIAVGGNGSQIAEGAIQAGLSAQNVLQFENSEEAAGYLGGVVHGGDFLLIKGSRGVRMDRVVQFLEGESP